MQLIAILVALFYSKQKNKEELVVEDSKQEEINQEEIQYNDKLSQVIAML